MLGQKALRYFLLEYEDDDDGGDDDGDDDGGLFTEDSEYHTPW